MDAEEYAAAEAVIVAAAVAYVASFSKYFLPQGLSLRAWLDLLALLFPAVQQARYQSAELARVFYDSERLKWHPTVERHDMFLETYEFKDFVADMEPAREAMSVEDASPKAVEKALISTQRAVQNGGRKQIIKSVKLDVRLDEEPYPDEPDRDDDDSLFKSIVDLLDEFKREDEAERQELKPRNKEGKAVRGWARVATGRETCEFCLMLVSRGPVYESARSAGLNLSNTEAVIANDKAINDAMTQWHVGCDCIVVPVFNKTKWEGAEAASNALDLWIQASRRARTVLDENPDKKYYSFKERRWKQTTHNREAINQLRSMVESGEISSSDWAALSAA